MTPEPPAGPGTVGGMPITAVVWDVDDTLFDYTTADREGMRSYLVAEGLLDRYGDRGAGAGAVA
ncbi:phosphoglycolate phosphatase-like HAD superfamily hydrolase [Streptomyces phaeoluteigriseus]